MLMVAACQALRIISFTVTQLPGPNYHCRGGEATAVRDMPSAWWGHVVVDLGRQTTHGCGDLIFSSHTTFVLVGVLTFTEYGETLVLKIIAWIGVAIMGLCIIASRKHYSVDVVVAWYTVPLVFYAMHRRWTTKRPVQDYWPHRPLVGEEAEAAEAIEAHALEEAKAEGGKPLLPVVTAPAAAGHSRQGSRSTSDLRLLAGKPPLPPKEPASPPPEGFTPEGGAMSRKALNGGNVRPRQGSLVGSGLGMEVELRDLESGASSGESPTGVLHNHRDSGSPLLPGGSAGSGGGSGGSGGAGQCRVM